MVIKRDSQGCVALASFPGLPRGGGGGGGGRGRPGTHCMRMRVNFPTFQEFRSTCGYLRVAFVTTVYYPEIRIP